MDAPQELDFRDNNFPFDEDNKLIGLDQGNNNNNNADLSPYAYNQPGNSQ